MGVSFIYSTILFPVCGLLLKYICNWPSDLPSDLLCLLPCVPHRDELYRSRTVKQSRIFLLQGTFVSVFYRSSYKVTRA